MIWQTAIINCINSLFLWGLHTVSVSLLMQGFDALSDWIDCVVCVHHQLDNCTLWQSKFSLLYIRDQLNKSRHYHVRHLKRQHVCGWHGTQLASEFDCWGAELDWIHWFACHFMSANVGLRWVESRICQYAFTQWGGTQNVFHNKYTI